MSPGSEPGPLTPDPNPVSPRFAVPPKACDSHFHIFGPVERYPMSPARMFTPAQATVEQCLSMHKALGIERGVAVHSAVYGTDLRCTYDALIRMEGKWRGICLMGPDTSRSELVRLHEAGFRGVRVNLIDGGVTTDALRPIAEKIAAFGWHIQLLVKLRTVEELVSVVSILPVDCVFDHMGFTRASEAIGHPGFEALVDLLKAGRCWVKLSGLDRIGNPNTEYADARSVMQALVDANPDRLVWGTDWPHVVKKVMPNDGALLNTFAAWVPEAKTRHKILVDNAERLYDF